MNVDYNLSLWVLCSQNVQKSPNIFQSGRGFHLNLLGVSKSAPTIMHFKINHVVAISIKGTSSVSELACLVMQDRVSLKIMLVKAKRAWLISSCRVSATHYKTGGCVVNLRSGVMLHGETKLWLRTTVDVIGQSSARLSENFAGRSFLQRGHYMGNPR